MKLFFQIFFVLFRIFSSSYHDDEKSLYDIDRKWSSKVKNVHSWYAKQRVE
jgi:hypothetical protein